MKFSLIFSDAALKSLKKLDPFSQQMIDNWFRQHEHLLDNPRSIGKALKGNLRGVWRYRVGKLRVLVEIRDVELLILVIDIANRNISYR